MCWYFIHTFGWLLCFCVDNTTIYVSIHQLIDIFGLFPLQVIIIALLWILYKTFCLNFFPVFQGLYLGEELLGHMEILCLAFWGLIKLFSVVVAAFYIQISNVRLFQFLHVHPNTAILFKIVVLMCLKWYLILSLICTLLMKWSIFICA